MELLIVGIIITILGGVVFTTFQGIQQKNRNLERVNDVKLIYTQLESYYYQNTKYPTLANMNDTTWRAANMKSLETETLRDPKGSVAALGSAVAPNVYSYVATPAGCDNAAKGDCTGYTLTATNEGGGNYVKVNLN